MKYDAARKPLTGKYCSRCGRQALDSKAKCCRVCKAPLFKYRPKERPEPRQAPQTLDELVPNPERA